MVRESQIFRKSYAVKMTEIIDECEKGMRQNAEAISNCITEFAYISKVHNDEIGLHVERL